VVKKKAQGKGPPSREHWHPVSVHGKPSWRQRERKKNPADKEAMSSNGWGTTRGATRNGLGQEAPVTGSRPGRMEAAWYSKRGGGPRTSGSRRGVTKMFLSGASDKGSRRSKLRTSCEILEKNVQRGGPTFLQLGEAHKVRNPQEVVGGDTRTCPLTI